MTNFEKEEEMTKNADTGKTERRLRVEQWLEIRKEAALGIDAKTAEVMWTYAEGLDPYGVDPDLPEECSCIDRECFVRAPTSDIWVWFGDLPDEVQEQLRKVHRSKQAFPAGIFDALPVL